MTVSALLSACVRQPEPEPSHPVADPNAQMQPEVMLVEPARARPGEIVSLTFTAPKDRGVAYAIELETDDGWQRLHLMVSDANGGEPRWFEAGEEPIVEAVGIAGPGPDRVPIPDVLPPGDYRICTANAGENICTPIEIIGASEEPAAVMRPDLLVAEPSVASPGEIVELMFPDETFRGVAFVLERQAGTDWKHRYDLVSTPTAASRSGRTSRPRKLASASRT